MKNNKKRISIVLKESFMLPRSIYLSCGFDTPVDSRERLKEVCLSSIIQDRF